MLKYHLKAWKKENYYSKNPVITHCLFLFCFGFFVITSLLNSRSLCWVGEEESRAPFFWEKHSYPGSTKPERDDKFYHYRKGTWGEEREDAVDITGDAGNHSHLNLTEWLNVSAFISKAHSQDFMVSCTLWSKPTWTVKGGTHSGSIYWAGILLSLIYLRELSLTSSAPTKNSIGHQEQLSFAQASFPPCKPSDQCFHLCLTFRFSLVLSGNPNSSGKQWIPLICNCYLGSFIMPQI